MIRIALVAGLLLTVSACSKPVPPGCPPPPAPLAPLLERLKPLLKAEPKIEEPKVEPRAVTKPKVEKKPKPSNPPKKVKKPKPVAKPAKRNCDDVRQRAGGRSYSQVEALAAQAGYKLTPTQRAAAKACL